MTTDIYTVALAIYAGFASVALIMLAAELVKARRELGRWHGAYQARRLRG